MDERFRNLCQRLAALTDLDEGRRDLPGILSRAAVVLREILSATGAHATMGKETVVATAEAVRSEAAKGPGTLGKLVLDRKMMRTWSRGQRPSPSASDRLGLEGAAWAGVPLCSDREKPGLLAVVRDDPLTEEEGQLLEIVSDHASVAVGNLLAFQEVESLSVTDDLTRVYNYRFLKAALHREVERASRYGQIFSILMIDVDHLKKFNAKNGHLRGSELLRQLAAILRESSRAIDLVAKYGGDEFLVILPQTSTKGAESMGRRICKAVAGTQFSHCQVGQITISTGVATFPQHGGTVQTLIAAADQALFDAKESGRNCVVSAKGPAGPGRLPEAA
jgi:diguanylate cyclase (GGDEF)-like protein